MPCYHPITGYQPHGGGPLSFREGPDHNQVKVPCGQCWGCRFKRSRDWGIRCMHEAQMHKHNCALTLTYDDKHVPLDLSLNYAHFSQFIRRMRKALGRGKPELLAARPHLRFYVGGEYGPRYGRPHFHACIFGVDFADKVYYKKSPAGSKLYESQTLDKLWAKGKAYIGDVNFQTAAYIARYIMKKRTGDGNKYDYHIINPDTGEIHIRKKEMNNMSRRPGVGSSWLGKYTSDVYPSGKVVLKAHQHNAPRYYDKLYKETNPIELDDIKQARFLEALAFKEHHTPERLAVQEQVHIAKTRSLQRNFE